MRGFSLAIMNTFSTTDIAKMTKQTTRKIISYVDRGYVTPSCQEADGHGSKRVWSLEDVYVIFVIQQLEKVHLKAVAIRKIVPQLYGCIPNLVEYPYVYVSNNKVMVPRVSIDHIETPVTINIGLSDLCFKVSLEVDSLLRKR